MKIRQIMGTVLFCAVCANGMDGDVFPGFGKIPEMKWVPNGGDYAGSPDCPVEMLDYDDGVLIVGRIWPEDNGEYLSAVIAVDTNGNVNADFGSNGVARIDTVPSGQPHTSMSLNRPSGICAQKLSADDIRYLVTGIEFHIDNGWQNVFVARLNADGSLDDGGPGDSTPGDEFGTEGIYIWDRNPAMDSDMWNAADIATADDGTIAVCGNDSDELAFVMLLDTNGAPVSTFGTNGIVTMEFTTSYTGDGFETVLFDTEGSLVLAGGTYGPDPFVVARMDRTGTLDADFDGDNGSSDGLVWIPGTSGIAGRMVEMDGALYLTSSYVGCVPQFASVDIVTGVLNTNFGTDGVVSGLGEGCVPQTLRLDGAGGILCGAVLNEKWLQVFRIIPSGIDWDFGESDGLGGKTGSVIIGGTTKYASTSGGRMDILPMSDGRVMVSSPTDFFNGYTEWGLMCLKTNGFIDSSIIQIHAASTGWTQEKILGNGVNHAVDLEVLPDGRILTVGMTSDASDGVYLARYLADGSPDITFSRSTATNCTRFAQLGKAIFIPKEILSEATVNFGGISELAVDDDGNIVVAGWVVMDLTTHGSCIYLARFTPEGELDPTFGASDGDGVDGFTWLDLSPVQAIADLTTKPVDMFFHSDGRIIVCSQAFTETGDHFDLFVSAFHPDGTLDTSFGTDGTFIYSPEDDIYCVPYAALEGRDGCIYAAGYLHSPSQDAVAVLRLNADGSLDSSFDGDGIVLYTPEVHAYCCDLALQRHGSQERVVLNTERTENTFGRLCSDGRVDASFGEGDGVVENMFSGGNLPAVANQADGRIIASNGEELVRLLRDGAVDDSFRQRLGADDLGFVVNNLTVAPDGESIVLVGTAGGQSVLCKLQTSSGSTLAAGFGQALQFDGAEDCVFVPGAADIQFAGSDSYSVMCWIKPQAVAEGYIYRMDGDTGEYRNYLRMQDNGKVMFGMQQEGSSADKLASIAALPQNKWSHVAAVKEGATMRLYVDGVSQGTDTVKTVTLNAPSSSLDTWLGVRGGDMNGWLDGTLDEVSLIKGALTQEQIQSWMYRSLNTDFGSWSNVLLHFSFDDPNESNIVSRTYSTHVGTLSNMTATAFIDSDIRGWQTWAGNTLVGGLVGNDLLGSSSNGMDWNLDFQIVSNGSLGTVTATGGNQFTFTPSAACPSGENQFQYRFVNVDGVTSDVATVSITIPQDWDGDLMNDSWEATCGLSPTNAADVSGNLDGDAFGNWAEFVADTDASDASDWFCLAAYTGNSNVTFKSSAERQYTLRFCTNLIEGGWADVPGQANVGGTGGEMTLTDPTSAGSPCYYRVQVELP